MAEQFNQRQFIWRSAAYYLRAHLGVLAGAIVGAAVLTGALLVGDSVRQTLRDMALARLGKIHFAAASNDRLFTSALAAKIAAGHPDTAAALALLGTANTADNSARANRVQVLGVDERFWGLADPPAPNLQPGEVALNERLAAQLKTRPGETILVRVPKPSDLSRDAPLSALEDSAVALRMTVAAILTERQLGRFSLQAGQVPPFNAFVPLAWLQQRVGATNEANLLLAGAHPSEGLRQAVQAHWSLVDAQLALRPLTNQTGLELRTARVFLEADIADVALTVAGGIIPHPGPLPRGEGREGKTPGRVEKPPYPVFTYFVNAFRSGTNTTPYSMITAAGPPLTDSAMRDDEIAISQWLAEDLKAKPGDVLELAYYVVGPMRKLVEEKHLFKVRQILPASPPWLDASLMPDFPGLTDAENCRDWDTGFPIDTAKIRDHDEAYWDQFRGSPKAFVTLAAGQKLWSNRFGNVTSIRYPGATDAAALEKALLARLAPERFGLRLEPVRDQALAASSQSQDFGQLFLGFSFFLIAAALLLVVMLFQFSVEQRAGEIGALLAIGFTDRQIRRFLLAEGGAVALLAAVLGSLCGIAYAKLMILGLGTIWRDAVGEVYLRFHASFGTFAIGGVSALLVSLGAIWLGLRKQARQPARELLAEGAEERGLRIEASSKKSRRALAVGLLCLLAATTLVLQSVAKKQLDPGPFFGAGALVLLAGLSLSSWQIGRFLRLPEAGLPNLRQLALRNVIRRPKRARGVIALLACGAFLIAAIGAFRLDARNTALPSSGTGGFELLGESALPVLHDLNSPEGRDFYGLTETQMAGVTVLPIRVREGDDASCLNLNRAQKPRLLGAPVALLETRRPFTFAKTLVRTDSPWSLLKTTSPSEPAPAIGDAASIQWALGKKVGDTLDFTGERGEKFSIRIVGAAANSILQGNLVISEEEFVKRFPSESGYRMFLIDAPSNRLEQVAADLSKALRDAGLELTPAAHRLAAFNAVQNTYLSTFQILGGLGLLIGSFGLGIVVMRNVFERRGELAVLRAVGFQPSKVRWMVLSEHASLLIAGLLVGLLAAAVAVLPAILTPGSELPLRSLLVTFAAVLANGAIWTWAATRGAQSGNIIEALRNQ